MSPVYSRTAASSGRLRKAEPKKYLSSARPLLPERVKSLTSTLLPPMVSVPWMNVSKVKPVGYDAVASAVELSSSSPMSESLSFAISPAEQDISQTKKKKKKKKE